MATPSLAMIPSGKKEGILYSVLPNTSVGDFTVERGSNATFVNEQGLIQSTNVIGGELVLNGNFSEEGLEQVTNGDFATDSGWIKLSGVTISNGMANAPFGSSGNILRQSLGVLDVNKTYRYEFTILNYVSGNVKFSPFIGASNQSGNGTYVAYGKPSDANNLVLFGSFEGSIDNVSVKEVGQNWDLGNKWSVIDDGIRLVSTTSNSSTLRQLSLLTIGKNYKITFDAEVVSGTAKLEGSGGVNILTINETKSYSIQIVADSTTLAFNRQSVTSDITIRNISAVEVTEATNTPRIDYTDGGCPVLLTEPQRTNLITQSNDFSNADWVKANSSIVGGFTSPDGGNNAYKLVENTANNEHRIGLGISVTNGNSYTFSAFIKKAENDWFRMALFGKGNTRVYFDLVNVTVGTSQNLVLNPFIESYSNDWYRIGFTYAATATESINPTLFLAQQDNESSYLGDGVSGTYIYGAQLEEGSYSTSLIPTYGSPYTRLGEVVKDAGDSSTFNSTEGVLFAEISALGDDADLKLFEINNSSTTDRVSIYYRDATIRTFVVVGGVTQSSFNITENVTEFKKVALKYSLNNFSLWIDGVEVDTDISGITSSVGTLNNMDFSNSGSLPFYGKTSQIQVFKTALSDAELILLTT